MQILSWNTNGLRATYKNGWMNWFVNEQPDILCLQETKAREDQLPVALREPEGYCSYFDSSPDGFCGVAIYSKTEPEKVNYSLGGRLGGEGRIIQADYDNFKLINIYFPSGSGQTKQEQQERLKRKFDFYEVFLDYMQDLARSDDNVVVCGDFNIAHQEVDLVNPDKACHAPGFLPEERKLLDTLISHGYNDTYRMFDKEPGNYTWWSYGYNCREKNIGMRLDHIFVTDN
jgi:exodeoxyribonuclease-3